MSKPAPRLSVPDPADEITTLAPGETRYLRDRYRRIRAREEARSRLSAGPSLLDRALGPVKAVAGAVATLGETVAGWVRR